jgi:hypothetical protein
MSSSFEKYFDFRIGEVYDDNVSFEADSILKQAGIKQ